MNGCVARGNMTHNGKRLCEEAEFEKQKFN